MKPLRHSFIYSFTQFQTDIREESSVYPVYTYLIPASNIVSFYSLLKCLFLCVLAFIVFSSRNNGECVARLHETGYRPTDR